MKILIYIQSSEDKINPISLEALAGAQQLKKQKNAEIYAVTFSEKISEALMHYDVNEIIYVDNESLREYSPLHFLEVFNHLNNDTGEKIGQSDAPSFPASQWKDGDRVISFFADKFNDQVKQLKVGMYTYPDLENILFNVFSKSR